MENVTLDRAVEVVRALTPEEQSQLRAMMDSWQTPMAAEAALEQERKFAEHLLAKGMITHIPERSQEGYAADDYQRNLPITVQGEPLSETIIRERR
ncbi:MAG: hypothetical protein ACRYFS_22280 [Janthinobacterium lividum]